MKKTKKLDFLGWNSNILISSLKQINLNIVLIVIIDALFYLISGYLVIFWLQRVQAKMAAFNIPADITSLGVEKAQQLVSDVKAFYYLIILSFIIILIAIIFLASLLKGIIWARITKTKISFALISRFLGLNLIWMSFWFTLVFLISLFVQPTSALTFMLITIILGLYFSNTLYTIFMKKQGISGIKYTVKLNIKKASSSSIHDLLVATKLASIDFLNTLKQIQIFTSIRDTIKLNITKIHMFLLPYAVISLLLLIINILSITTKLSQVTFLVLVKMYSFVGIDVSVATSTGVPPLAEIQIILLISMLLNPLTLLLFAFFRYYVSSLVNGLAKP
ncbi:hypothetical protein HYX05_02995 [Candidatus Woesearchaeota archaeon]|nr:hypothetical protein [Candidatus Woesearchaeota archaeon]